MLKPMLRFGVVIMKKVEFQNYHAREAARLRSLIAVATTPAVKARLTEQAEESERLTYGFAEDEGEAELQRAIKSAASRSEKSRSRSQHSVQRNSLPS